jgi:nicotinamide-nucleotide amidase
LLGDVVFGIDEQSMEVVVLEALRRKGLSLAVAETVTGGLLAARMSAADPAMETFRGARISRSAQEAAQASPEQQAVAAAVQVRSEFAAGVGLAAIASAPDGSERNRIVPVVLAAAIGDARLAEKVILPADPRRLRDFAVIGLLNLLRRNLVA